MVNKRNAVSALWNAFTDMYASNDVSQQRVDDILSLWKNFNPEFDREDYTIKLIKNEFGFELDVSESFTMLFDEASEEQARTWMGK